MRLDDLEPKLLKYEPREDTWDEIEGDPATWRERGCPTRQVTGTRDVYRVMESLDEADGIQFKCPKCFQENGGLGGTHMVLCWFRGRVPDHIDPKPGRWTPQGTGFGDLTFVPGDPPMAVSVLLLDGCGWHGFINGGEVI